MATRTFTFRWQDGRFMLIGFDEFSVQRNTGTTGNLSVNYLTRRMKHGQGNIAYDNDTTTWRRLPPAPLPSLAQVGSGMDFEPPTAVAPEHADN